MAVRAAVVIMCSFMYFIFFIFSCCAVCRRACGLAGSCVGVLEEGWEVNGLFYICSLQQFYCLFAVRQFEEADCLRLAARYEGSAIQFAVSVAVLCYSYGIIALF